MTTNAPDRKPEIMDQIGKLIATAKAEIKLGDAAAKIASVHHDKASEFWTKATKADDDAEAHWIKAGKALFALQQQAGKSGKSFAQIVKTDIGISLSTAYDYMKMPGVRPANYQPTTGRPAKTMTLADHRAGVAERQRDFSVRSAANGKDAATKHERLGHAIEEILVYLDAADPAKEFLHDLPGDLQSSDLLKLAKLFEAVARKLNGAKVAQLAADRAEATRVVRGKDSKAVH